MTKVCQLTAVRVGTGRYQGLVYDRFFTPVAEMLDDAGEWRVLKRNGCYALCSSVNGSLPKLKVMVPEPKELLEFAGELHRLNVPWEGTVLGWPGRFVPAQTGKIVESEDWASDDEEVVRCRPAILEVGICGLFRCVVEWWGGDIELWIED